MKTEFADYGDGHPVKIVTPAGRAKFGFARNRPRPTTAVFTFSCEDGKVRQFRWPLSAGKGNRKVPNWGKAARGAFNAYHRTAQHKGWPRPVRIVNALDEDRCVDADINKVNAALEIRA